MPPSTPAVKEDAIQRAFAAVKSGAMKANQAANIFEVPRSTLYDRLKGALPKVHAHVANQLLNPAQVCELCLIALSTLTLLENHFAFSGNRTHRLDTSSGNACTTPI
jgi:hypothetical protein